MKSAFRIWPDAPSFKLSVLRYHLDLDVKTDASCPAHRAMADVLVTVELFKRLLAAGASVEDMAAWEQEPGLIPRIPFGKHRGSEWQDIPIGYLNWAARTDLGNDVLFCVWKELARRTAGEIYPTPL